MNISEALTAHLKGRTFYADVEIYNSNICQMEYFKNELIKVGKFTMSESGENIMTGYVILGENTGKECTMNFDIETEFNFID